MKRALVLVLLAGVTAPAAAHADAVSPDVLAAIKSVKASDYPSANSVTVLDSQYTAYQADGRYQTTTDGVRLVLTNDGRDDVAHASVAYVTDYDHLENLSARVIKADGTVVPIPDSAIQDEAGSAETSAINIYGPNNRTKEIDFPDLDVGDATEVTYTDVVDAPMRENYFEGVDYFMSTEPVLQVSYEIQGPKSMPLTIRTYHPERGTPVAFTKTQTGSGIDYKWVAKNEPQLIPEMLMDPGMELPSVRVSTDPSWQSESRWCSSLDEPKLKITDSIKAQVAQLTLGKTTDDEKIKALFDFVSSNVRYRGGAYSSSGAVPKAAEDTLTSREGICRDVAVLLVTMLRAAGYTAYPVLTNAESPIPEDIAITDVDHEIVALQNPGGGWTFMDPTAKNMLNYLPAEEAQDQVLVCTPRGENIAETPAVTPASNLGHATAQSTLSADGTMTADVKLETKGLLDEALRGVGAMMSPDQQRQAVEQVLHASLPELQLTSYKLSNPLDLSTPMEVDFQVKVPNAAAMAGNYWLLRTLVTSNALGLVENFLPQVMGALPTRQYTLDIHTPFEYDEDETITLPAGSQILAPPNDVAEANAVSALTSQCKATDATTVTCHRGFQLRSRYIDPNQYTELRSVFASLDALSGQPVILAAPAQPAANTSAGAPTKKGTN
jgi:transglutaminase-like putative cysteine protease